MKAATAKPLSSLMPKDAVTTAALKAREDDDKIESISFSLRKRDIRIISQRARAMSEHRDAKPVSMSSALRDILEGVGQ